MNVERVLLYVIAVLFLAVAGTQAQNVSLTPSVLYMPSGAVAANCPAPTANVTTYCWAYDKFQVSGAGGAYAVIWPSPVAAPQITINNTTKTLPASFTISGSTTVPGITLTSPNTSIVAQ